MPGAIVTPFCQSLRRVGLLLGLTLALSAQAQTSFEVTEASIHDLQIAMTAKPPVSRPKARYSRSVRRRR